MEVFLTALEFFTIRYLVDSKLFCLDALKKDQRSQLDYFHGGNIC